MRELWTRRFQWNTLFVVWLWEPHDLWVGAYWKRTPQTLTVYVCVLPCLPLKVVFAWKVAGADYRIYWTDSTKRQEQPEQPEAREGA